MDGRSSRSTTASATAQATERSWEYSGFWVRLGALVIDGVILAVVSIVLFLAFDEGPAALLEFVIGFTYFVVGNAWGGTPGKRALGLRVIDRAGDAPGLARSLVRYLVAGVSGLALGLGYLWMLMDEQRQTWHDKAAGTYVIRL